MLLLLRTKGELSGQPMNRLPKYSISHKMINKNTEMIALNC